jgi:hypothetical protein
LPTVVAYLVKSHLPSDISEDTLIGLIPE